MKIYAWPYNIWYYEEDVEEVLSYLSDNFFIMNVDPYCTREQIQELVEEHNRINSL